jgi:hypothetical protein
MRTGPAAAIVAGERDGDRFTTPLDEDHPVGVA